jgi:hypothetical protein
LLDDAKVETKIKGELFYLFGSKEKNQKEMSVLSALGFGASTL